MKQTRFVDGRAEMWLPWPFGGWVCAEADSTQADGMCGYTLNGQPCPIHHLEATA